MCVAYYSASGAVGAVVSILRRTVPVASALPTAATRFKMREKLNTFVKKDILCPDTVSKFYSKIDYIDSIN